MISPQVFSRKGGGAKASGRGGAARAPSASGLDDVFGFHPEEEMEEIWTRLVDDRDSIT